MLAQPQRAACSCLSIKREVCRESDAIVMAVKPQMLTAALTSIVDDAEANSKDKAPFALLSCVGLL